MVLNYFLIIQRRKPGHWDGGVGVAKEDPVPGAGAQSVHVRDDNHIAGVRAVHGAVGVRVQKDHVDRSETDAARVVVNSRLPDDVSTAMKSNRASYTHYYYYYYSNYY